MQNGLVANIEEGNPHPPAIKGSNGKSQLCSMLFSTQTFIIHGGFSLFPNVFFPMFQSFQSGISPPSGRADGSSLVAAPRWRAHFPLGASEQSWRFPQQSPAPNDIPGGTHLELVYGRNYRKPWFLSSNRLSCTFSSSVVEEWRRGMAFYPIVAEKDQVVPEAIERITKQCHINIFLHNMLLFVLWYFLRGSGSPSSSNVGYPKSFTVAFFHWVNHSQYILIRPFFMGTPSTVLRSRHIPMIWGVP